MADDDLISKESDAVLSRVDALMQRHRAPRKSDADIPTLTETIGGPDIPVLTDAIAPPPPMPASTPSTAMTPLEESVYLKLRQALAQEIDAMTPQAAAAFDSALRKVSADLQDDIQSLIRNAVEQVFNQRNAGSAGIMPASSANTPKTK